MRARLLTAAIALTVLVCGATVGLEAVGLLYPSGAPATQEAEEHTQAILARFETDLDSMVAPSGPVDLPNEAPPPWKDAGPTTAAAPAPDAAPTTAAAAAPEAQSATAAGEPPADARPEGSERQALAFSMRADDPAPPDQQPPPTPPSASEPEPVAVLAAVQTAQPARSVQPRSARSERVAAARSRAATEAGGWGCPVLDWLSQ
jgi:hypothetical protein